MDTGLRRHDGPDLVIRAPEPGSIAQRLLRVPEAFCSGQGLLRNVGPREPYCISTLHSGHTSLRRPDGLYFIITAGLTDQV
jgi:hypothetical protein